MYKELLIGCGSKSEKALYKHGRPFFGEGLVRLDINPDHKPDVVWDLEQRPLPFEDNEFDEIHAYEVLEHVGRQGDYRGFFEEFSEYWRILKPNGCIYATVPRWDSPWAYGDPSHTRVLPLESLVFLDQSQYQVQVGKTAMSDFRYIYKADFRTVHVDDEHEHTVGFVLQAVKGQANIEND